MKALNGWWIVSDVDGTLIDECQLVVESNRWAVRRFCDAGGRFILATGRIEASVREYYNYLDLTTPAILYNGARVVGPGLGPPVYSRSLSLEHTSSLTSLFDAAWGHAVPIFYAEGVAYSNHADGVVSGYERKDSISVKPLKDWISRGQPQATKVLCIAEPKYMTELVTYLRAIVPGATLVRSERTYLEVLPRSVNKGIALDWLMGEEGIDPSRVVAVGDNLNDVQLLQVAGLGVAVGDGHPELQRVADLVVGACHEGAVSQVVDLLFAS